MMNQWNNEQYSIMSNMMGSNMGLGANMGPPPNMGPALLPTPMPSVPPGHGGMIPPLAPSAYLLGDWSQGNAEASTGADPKGPGLDNFIGPVIPNSSVTKENEDKDSGNDRDKKKDRDSRDNRRDAGDRNRGDRSKRPRSPHRNSRDRNDRSRGDKRRSSARWSDIEEPAQGPGLGMGNNMMNMAMPANNMMAYSNMMGQQSVDVTNMTSMPNMASMPNIPTMANMPNMPVGSMMPGMNMMSNMMPNMMPVMDQNMMMMHQQMSMNMNSMNQPIYVLNGVLLPPLPNASTPTRRERPPGCRTIFVGGLPHGLGEDVIRDIFQRFGNIVDIKLHKQGVCHVRFDSPELVENAFFISGYRFKYHNQLDNEATTVFIDYAVNRDDQNEFERNKSKRASTPPRIEPYSPAALTTIMEKIKSDTEFNEAAPTLAGWLERGECNKRNANTFYSLIQTSNNQIRRLYNEKMAIDEEYHTLKSTLKDKFAHVITQFEHVGKILTAAKMQRVSDHFSKQQRRNIEMWLKMTEDVENIKEEYNIMFDEDDGNERGGKVAAVSKKYEDLKVEYESLQYELEGYKNEAHLAKDEAERKFEKFKAHFIAQQALQNNSGQNQVYPPLPPVPPPQETPSTKSAATGSENKVHLSSVVAPSEAKLISVLTAFLLVHPIGASLDYLVSYVRSIIPNATQATVHTVLQKHNDVFQRQTKGVGANIESKWTFVTYDVIKKEVM